MVKQVVAEDVNFIAEKKSNKIQISGETGICRRVHVTNNNDISRLDNID